MNERNLLRICFKALIKNTPKNALSLVYLNATVYFKMINMNHFNINCSNQIKRKGCLQKLYFR